MVSEHKPKAKWKKWQGHIIRRMSGMGIFLWSLLENTICHSITTLTLVFTIFIYFYNFSIYACRNENIILYFKLSEVFSSIFSLKLIQIDICSSSSFNFSTITFCIRIPQFVCSYCCFSGLLKAQQKWIFSTLPAMMSWLSICSL